MTVVPHPRLLLAAAAVVAAALAAPPSRADSLTSSASSAASQSVGSLSGSIGRSSDASSPDNRRVSDGDYRVIDVAAAGADHLRLTLRGPAGAGAADVDEFTLDVPRATAEQAGLGRGDTVTARNRPYGIEFARAGADGAFFLALEDDWLRQLAATPVPL